MKNIFFFFLALLSLGCPSPPNMPPDNQSKAKRDFVWSIDTMFFDTPGIPSPDQVYMYAIWGSSPHDVWAAGQSDIPWGRLWHYDGNKWTPDKKWVVSGSDEIGTYIVYPYAVTGFDGQNVFVACARYYDEKDTVLAMVLKWNGLQWIDVPWENNTRAQGGLAWIVQQNKNRLWAASAAGLVVKYENGFLSVEPRITDIRLDGPTIAALDDDEVYLNAWKDSLNGEVQIGSITKLFMRSRKGDWSLLEDKFILGADFDGNGLGRGAISIGNRLFCDNRGLWERTGSSWQKQLDIYGLGGECLITEDNMWIYFNHEIWQNNGVDWEQIQIAQLESYRGSFLYGSGWSNNSEIFLSLHYNGKTYIVHGK